MILVLPAVPLPDGPFAAPKRIVAFLRRARRTARAAGCFTRIVVAASPLMAGHLADFDHVLLPDVCAPPGPHLPPGTHEALEALAPDGPVAVMDLRAGGLAPEHILAVVRCGQHASSTSTPADHPCLWRDFLQATDAWYLHRLDPGPPQRTAPYPAPHRAPGMAETFYADGTAAITVDLAPIAALNPALSPEAVTHVAANPDGGIHATVAGRMLALPDATRGGQFEIHVPGSRAVIACTTREDGHHRLAQTPPNAGLLCVRYEVLRGSGPYDAVRPAPPPGVDWRTKDGRLVTANGTPIHGRQMRPDCPLPDGALTVAPSAHVLLDAANAVSVQLPDNAGALVEDEFSCLRMELSEADPS